jgi:hypothetical protein
MGQSVIQAAHWVHANWWPHGRNTTPISRSKHILHNSLFSSDFDKSLISDSNDVGGDEERGEHEDNVDIEDDCDDWELDLLLLVLYSSPELWSSLISTSLIIGELKV